MVAGAKDLSSSAWTHPHILVKDHITCHPTGLHVRLPTEFLQLGNEEQRVTRLHRENLKRRLWLSRHKDYLLFHRDGEKNMEAGITVVVKVEKVPAINTQKYFFMLLTK